MDERQAKPANATRRHETTDADIRAIVKFAVGLFLGIILALVIVKVVFDYFVAHQGLGPPASPFDATRELPPAGVPRLQVSPPKELGRYEGEQRKLLDSYGWIDQKNGIVRIPIDRAMDLLVQRGLPVQTSPPEDEIHQGTVPQYQEPKGYMPGH